MLSIALLICRHFLNPVCGDTTRGFLILIGGNKMKEKIEDIIEDIKELQKYTGGGDIKISYDGNQTPQEKSDTVTVTVTASIPTDQQGYIQKEYIWNERVVFFGESLRRGWGILRERNIRRNKYSFSAATYVQAYAAATAYAKAELLKISRAQ